MPQGNGPLHATIKTRKCSSAPTLALSCVCSARSSGITLCTPFVYGPVRAPTAKRDTELVNAS